MSFYRSYTLLLSLPVFMHSWQMQVTFPRWNSTHLSGSCCFVLETYVTIVCNNHSKTSRRLTYTGTDESKQFLFSSVSVLLNSSELYSVLVDVIVTVIMCFDSLNFLKTLQCWMPIKSRANALYTCSCTNNYWQSSYDRALTLNRSLVWYNDTIETSSGILMSTYIGLPCTCILYYPQLPGV